MDSEPDTGIEGAASPSGDGVPSRSHRLRNVLLVVVGVVAIFLAVVVGSYVFRPQPGARSISAAAGAFEATTTTVPTPRAFTARA